MVQSPLRSAMIYEGQRGFVVAMRTRGREVRLHWPVPLAAFLAQLERSGYKTVASEHAGEVLQQVYDLYTKPRREELGWVPPPDKTGKQRQRILGCDRRFLAS